MVMENSNKKILIVVAVVLKSSTNWMREEEECSLKIGRGDEIQYNKKKCF